MNKQISELTAQSGFTFLEVLVAVIVLSIGLIGLAGMQSSALAYNKESLQRSQAVALAGGVMDTMRANRNNASAYTANYTADAGAPVGGNVVLMDTNMWRRRLASELGNGSSLNVCVSDIDGACDIGGDYVRVSVSWADRITQGGAPDALQAVAIVGRL